MFQEQASSCVLVGVLTRERVSGACFRSKLPRVYRPLSPSVFTSALPSSPFLFSKHSNICICFAIIFCILTFPLGGGGVYYYLNSQGRGALPYRKDGGGGGVRRTLGVKKRSSHTHKKGSWYLLEVLFNFLSHLWAMLNCYNK